MKCKLFALTLVLAIATVSVKAQFIQLGLKAGTNVFKIDGKSFSDEFRFGYHAGGFMQLKLSDKWHLQPELLWNQYNTKTDTSFGNIYKISNLSDVKLNYLSVPILLSYTPSKFISLQAGPQFGVLMDKNRGLFQNGREAFKTGDLSMLAGLQLNLGSLRLTGRYVIGLNNINDIDNKDRWKNQGFQLGLGLRLL
jgi:hypothetical protein